MSSLSPRLNSQVARVMAYVRLVEGPFVSAGGDGVCCSEDDGGFDALSDGGVELVEFAGDKLGGGEGGVGDH